MQKILTLSLATLTAGLLTGCSVITTTATPSKLQGEVLQGAVHGGQAPIVGARVYLYEAGTGGYNNASVSILQAGGNTQSDGANNYVLTGAAGEFSITGDYDCDPGAQVYLYATGGNAGGGVNSSIGLLSILGECPAAAPHNFASSVPFIWVNEVTTIAAAYSIAGFASDALHVSAPSATSAQARLGISNAFANFSNIAAVDTGAAYQVVSKTYGTLFVPQSRIYTLANILAACINSSDANPTLCTSLFGYVKSDGAQGTTASDTATEAIYIAHNPGSDTADLCGLQPGIGAPYQPSLDCSVPPTDFILALVSAGGGLYISRHLAIDANSHIWASNQNNSISEFNGRTATPVSSFLAYQGGGLNYPFGIAINPNGNVWVADLGSNKLSEFYGSNAPSGHTSGEAISPQPQGYFSSAHTNPSNLVFLPSGSFWNADTTYITFHSGSDFLSGYVNSPSVLDTPYDLAVDLSGNVWVPSLNANTLTEFDSSGALVATYTGNGLNAPISVAVDALGYVWVLNSGSGHNSVSRFYGSNASGGHVPGEAVAGSPYTGNLFQPYSLVIDGAGNVWVTCSANSFPLGYGSVFGFYGSSASGPHAPGDPISVLGYNGGDYSSGVNLPAGLGIDSSGNIWVTNSSSGALAELVGAASPVVTPRVANFAAPYGAAVVNKP